MIKINFILFLVRFNTMCCISNFMSANDKALVTCYSIFCVESTEIGYD